MPIGVSSRYLITTADERSWKLDRPVLFLGEWCRRYDRRHVWSSMDADVAAPFGIAPGEKMRDVDIVRDVAADLLSELAEALNELHCVAHSRRYWQIVIGHWLLRCVAVVFNRYHTVGLALRNYELSGTTEFVSGPCALTTTTSTEFVWACSSDVWNHLLYSRVLGFLGGVAEHSVVELPGGPLSRFREPAPQINRSRDVRLALAGAMSAMLPTLSREDDAVLINTYLPLMERIKLELSLGQCPQVWRTPALRKWEPEPSYRDRLNLRALQHEGFGRFIRLHLKELIPSCYLEGYAELHAQAASLAWPSSPELIYTANNFDSDEIFKVWVAEKVERGARYVTGQHGNNYGTHIWAGAEFWPERAASDRFVTWGWTDGDQRTAPAFLFRTAGRPPSRRNQHGGLLLIEMPVSHRIDPSDSYAEFAIYQEEQFRFVESLPASICSEVTVRLHAEYRKFPWGEEERWRDRSPRTRLELGRAPIGRLIEASRLVVHSYDSTGILETLALDKPTMCFWNGGLEHLLPSAKPYYELLNGAGILYDTPERATAAVATNWGDVFAWWDSATVQRARRDFCDRYARSVRNPARTLKEILRGTCSESGTTVAHDA